MPLLLLTDIHGNIDALDAVLDDAGPVDGVICLGDLVGYGAAPADVIAKIRALAPQWILRGNHDRVAAGLTHAGTFSPTARAAIEWTQRRLDPGDLEWLRHLPIGPLSMDTDTLLCHGAPRDEDYYIQTFADARLVFSDRTFCIALHGHTHLQSVFRLRGAIVHDETPIRRGRVTVAMTDDSRWLINPGSVGQPRDGDARAAYAMLDVEARTIELRRVAYDVARAQARIRDAGLPASLAGRLATGE